MTHKPSTLFLLLLAFPLFFNCKNNTEKKDTTTSLISLKESFKNDFLIGAAISRSQINQTDSLSNALLKKEFNSISPENDMKWEQIHPEKDSYYFETADKYVALGEKNNMHIVGHTLLWHSQLAPWVHTIKDSATLANTIKTHITKVAGRYKGRIDTWDVVNEALNEDGTLRESLFLKLMGEKYIAYAFKIAAETDPDAKLIYNDYNLWKPEKRAGVVKLVKSLQEEGIKIDGVGMQAHWSLLGPSIEDIENSIIAYSDLGVKVSFTELDITALPNPWDLDGAAVEQSYEQFESDPKMNPYPIKLTDSAQTQLAKRYEDIFKLFLKHKDKIDRVTFWGVNDDHSWLNNWPIKGRTNHPLLFDRNYEPKKAYHSVLALKNK
ncbi:endo-1,4-beta-xylanase [Gelidibacter salicanalis]|uniref:Beta-xylanase n=1 Tax=Gelidibacter salicanalis TaxID=291193 RepID=A0A934KMV0_9FLAO|nr:endo-1,4-beta-xylanase [Gelidibacter salicanalis]MBJ7880639.1 endo-1,4-beta-xylanase [Gelidibacter salicanalis]